jgi:hypothetical protein
VAGTVQEGALCVQLRKDDESDYGVLVRGRFSVQQVATISPHPSKRNVLASVDRSPCANLFQAEYLAVGDQDDL